MCSAMLSSAPRHITSTLESSLARCTVQLSLTRMSLNSASVPPAQSRALSVLRTRSTPFVPQQLYSGTPASDEEPLPTTRSDHCRQTTCRQIIPSQIDYQSGRTSWPHSAVQPQQATQPARLYIYVGAEWTNNQTECDITSTAGSEHLDSVLSRSADVELLYHYLHHPDTASAEPLLCSQRALLVSPRPSMKVKN